jgi:bifunctional DNA-binding transcriptional regulator/antitoxin component of YhaV-PrlF toxin-antitoxin module
MKTIDTARLDDKGRVTIPKLVKESLDLTATTKEKPGSLIRFVDDGKGRVYIERLD